MFRAIIITVSMAAAITGAATMAIASNTSERVTSENTAPMIVAKNTQGIVNCEAQVWPAIDTLCLTPASDEGEVRQARLIRF